MAEGAGTTVTVCPNGPLLIRGAYEIRGADGTEVPHDRQVIALCRCGRSRLKPLCDGSHKAARFVDRADPDDMTEVLRLPRPAASRGDRASG